MSRDTGCSFRARQAGRINPQVRLEREGRVQVEQVDQDLGIGVLDVRPSGIGLNEWRWWTISELQATQNAYDAAPKDPSVLTFSPRRLGDLITDLLANGRPRELRQLDPV